MEKMIIHLQLWERRRGGVSKVMDVPFVNMTSELVTTTSEAFPCLMMNAIIDLTYEIDSG